jgi:hypothetical protein
VLQLCPRASGRTPWKPAGDLPINYDYVACLPAPPPLSLRAEWDNTSLP